MSTALERVAPSVDAASVQRLAAVAGIRALAVLYGSRSLPHHPEPDGVPT